MNRRNYAIIPDTDHLDLIQIQSYQWSSWITIRMLFSRSYDSINWKNKKKQSALKNFNEYLYSRINSILFWNSVFLIQKVRMKSVENCKCERKNKETNKQNKNRNNIGTREPLYFLSIQCIKCYHTTNTTNTANNTNCYS